MRRQLRWWCGLGVLAVVTACSGVPTSGGVHFARALPGTGGNDDSTVRQLPPGPTAKASPTELVDGFLNAQIDSDNDYGVARLFLAPGTPWSTVGATVYDGNPLITRTAADRIDVRVARTGRVDARGSYTTDPGVLHIEFRLDRRAGAWRITRLTSGVLLSTIDAQRVLAPVEIYYLNRDQTRLVPDPILVPPVQSGLATTLMTALLQPPNRDLSPAVVTAAPAGTTLLGNVPIDSHGVAEVDLSSGIQQAPPSQLERLLAQIVWTLRQVPSVTAVRVLANGAPVVAPGIEAQQEIGAFGEFDPDGLPAVAGALASDHGRVVGLVGATVPPSLGHATLFAPRRSAAGLMVAALTGQGRLQTLEVGTAAGGLRRPFTPSELTAPAFDPSGNLFIARGVAPDMSVVEVTTDNRAHHVEIPRAVLRLGIDALAISPEGSRIAVTVGPVGHEALMVGALGGTATRPIVASLSLVVPADLAVSGLAWAGAAELVTTVRGGDGHRVVRMTGVDGYQPRDADLTGLGIDPVQVAAAPGQPLLAAAADGTWSYTGGRWHRVSPATDPSYAG